VVAVKISEGRVFDIYALEHKGRRELLNFLVELRMSSRQEFTKLVRYFDWTKDTGIIKNEYIFKRLTVDIYEFKTRGGVRVLCFFDERSMVILTNGFKKKKKYDDEITKAENLRRAYFDAKLNNELKYIEELL
jgi:Phage derived protein Gp49-like (DUF891)